MRSCLFFLLFGVFANKLAFSQAEASKWYFGSYAALDFLPTQPASLPSPSMLAPENSASVADAAGNLLFYTNSETVWNSYHNVMANGSGLLGNMNTTQSLIVKQPGSAFIYYVFTMDDSGGPNGLRYSIVDMSLAAGVGSVTAKNVLVYAPCSEKLAATAHCNGTDIWIVSHSFTGNTFNAYLLTTAGLSTNPAVSVTGSAFVSNGNVNSGWWGQMKISPTGTKLGFVIPSTNPQSVSASSELFDFNNSTGAVSNSFWLGFGYDVYGCEFSPDGSKFYTANAGLSTITQWDLCAFNATTSFQSQFTGPTNYFGALQLAPDGKIYVARNGNPTLGVITFPNAGGSNCNYNDVGPTLVAYNNLPAYNQKGLPGFVASTLKKGPFFIKAQSCQTATFTAPPPICSDAGPSFTNISWNFGDPASGAANTSTLQNPQHTYAITGTYLVKMMLTYPCFTDTIRINVPVFDETPFILVAGDFLICKDQSASLTANGADTYTWSAGGNGPTTLLSPTVSTAYTVTGTNTLSGCTSKTTFTVGVDACTGLEHLNLSNSVLTIYPNPGNGDFIFETIKNLRVIIYDLRGNVMDDQFLMAGKTRLDLSGYNNGFYLVKTSDGNAEKMTRLVKTE